QHHTLLVDEYGGIFGSYLLGEQVRLLHSEGCRHPGCRERLSRRGLYSPAELGSPRLSEAHLLQQARQRRSLRGLGATATLRTRGSRGLQTPARVVDLGVLRWIGGPASSSARRFSDCRN